MRVLLVDLAKTFGGAEVRVLTQAQALQNQTEKCAVAVLENSPLHRRVTEYGVPCEVLRLGRGNPRMLLALRPIVKQYDIVDAHNVHSIFWGHLAAWSAGVKGRVATIHSNYGQEYPNLKGRLYEATLALNRRIAREYITVTEVLQQKYAPRISSTLIYNAVQVPSEPFQGKKIGVLPFEHDDFVVGIVGRLVPVKGHKYMIEALARMEDRVKLAIVGEGTLRAALEEQVNQLGLSERVHFTGFREDIPDILQALDCLCMPSLSEAMPFVALEAGAYARPIVASQVGGLATLLAHGENALLVAPEAPAGLASAILQLLEQPELRTRLGLAGYTMVKQSFSAEEMIKNITAVYRRAM